MWQYRHLTIIKIIVDILNKSEILLLGEESRHIKKTIMILLNSRISGSPRIHKVDIPTPHKISVVLLIHHYLKIKEAAACDSSDDETSMPTVTQPPASRRKFSMLLLKLIQYPDMSFRDLYTLLTTPKYKVDAEHLKEFEKNMSDLNSLGIESLFDTENLMRKMVRENCGISPMGIIGCYIRRILLTLDKMSFPEMRILYKTINIYYEKGIRALALCSAAVNTEENPKEMDIDIESTKIFDAQTINRDRNNHCKWSIKQAEVFIAQQCQLLENNEIRALPPIELQTKLNDIIQDNPLFAQAHFLSYMNNLRIRDYFNALDCLYRTFDRNPTQTSTSTMYSRGFQYSSLNLAIMHAAFNHKKEALVSLRECVMLAQESGDRQCLDLANAWYCILNTNKIEPLDKCLPDQSDVSMRELLALSIQFMVKVGAYCGYKPKVLFEMLMKSDKISCHDSLIEYVGSSLAIKSALWSLYGKNELASVSAQLLLKLKNSVMFGDFGNSESVCKVLCCLALWLSIQGELALCSVVLHHAKERFPRDPLAKSWMLCDCYITVTQSIFKCEWQAALKTCCQLSFFDRPASILQRATVYIAKRNVAVAKLMLDNLLESSDLDSITRLRALILLCYSLVNEEEVSSQVVDILVDASRLAKDEYFEYEGALVDMIFAQVLLYNNMPHKGLRVVTGCMETILSNGGIYDKAKTLFVFVKCSIDSVIKDEDIPKKVTECMDIVEQIVVYFKKLNSHAKVLDVYSYLATLFNKLKLTEERNKFALKFRKYHMKYPITREYLNVFY